MRRSLFISLVVVLVAFGLYRWERVNSQSHGVRRTSDRYTAADGPRIDPRDLQVLSELDAEYTRLTQAVVPSVVSVTTTGHIIRDQRMNTLDFLFGRRPLGPQTQTVRSLGSGVIVSREGHIITNNHVIAGMDTIEVQLTDGRVEPAKLIGTDEQTDIAILKINADKIEPLPLGDSDQVRAGQLVFAIGNPFGLQETVTQGIISAKGRAMADSSVEFLQTDAAVNEGNSGGPLLNVRGEVIGINSAIYSKSQDAGWLGISFAIPSNVARRALESVLKNGRIVRGYLGVSMVDLTPAIARELGVPPGSGAAIASVLPGSPAEKAGLKPRDIVQTVNKRPIRDTLSLRGQVAESDIGARLELGIIRDGKEQTVTAVIAEAPAEAQKPVRQ